MANPESLFLRLPPPLLLPLKENHSNCYLKVNFHDPIAKVDKKLGVVVAILTICVLTLRDLRDQSGEENKLLPQY